MALSEIEALISEIDFQSREVVKNLLKAKVEVQGHLESEDLTVEQELVLNNALKEIENSIQKFRVSGINSTNA